MGLSKKKSLSILIKADVRREKEGEQVGPFHGEELAREMIAFLKADAAAYLENNGVDEDAKAQLSWHLSQINRTENILIRIIKIFEKQGYPAVANEAMLCINNLLHAAFSIGNNRGPNKSNRTFSARVNSQKARNTKTISRLKRIDIARTFIKSARRDSNDRIININQLRVKVSKALKMQKCISSRTMARYVAEVDRDR